MSTHRRNWRRLGPAVVSVAACASADLSVGQAPLYEFEGQAGNDLRSGIVRLGDIDHRGVDDFAVAGGGLVISGGFTSNVKIYAGEDGDLILEVPPAGVDPENLRNPADAGDFNGDGTPDIVVGGPTNDECGPNLNCGRVVVFSGRDGTVLASMVGLNEDDRLGLAVAGIGDVDDDGYDDVIAASGRYVQVSFGPDGQRIRHHEGPLFWPWVDGLGDVNGDEIPDYLIGWPQDSTNASFAGRVDVHSGSDGSVIRQVYGDAPSDHLGISVAGLGDLNGDGVADFVAGAPGAYDPTAGLERGYARVYSGADGQVIFEVAEVEGELANFGDQVDGAGDVNGDGIPDLVVGAPNDENAFGSVNVFSGATGTLLWKVVGDHLFSRIGGFNAILGDLNGDGISEWGWGDPSDDTAAFNAGRVTIYSGAPGDATSTCTTSPNSDGPGAEIGTQGPISAGADSLSLTASGGPPGQPGVFYYGPEEQHVPFGNGVGCVGQGQTGFFRLEPPVFSDASGGALFPVDFSGGPVQAGGPGAWVEGSTWYVQFWYRDPAAGGAFFNLSDAIELVPTTGSDDGQD